MIRRLCVLALVSAAVFTGCTLLEKPGPYGNAPRKIPLETEEALHRRAMTGPFSPEEPLSTGDFVGWFGVILETETTDESVTGIVLDHRYADDVNIQYGFVNTRSINTVSLYGGGVFETTTSHRAAGREWLAGDLLRVYGTVAEATSGTWRVKPVYFRYWPRWEYELAPLRPVWTEERTIVRKRMADGSTWPDLRWDHSVAAKASPVDEIVRSQLLTRFAESDPDMRRRIAITLGELGGDECVSTLRTAVEGALDPQTREIYAESLRRAERRVGPRWRPHAPYPYWKEKDAPRPGFFETISRQLPDLQLDRTLGFQ